MLGLAPVPFELGEEVLLPEELSGPQSVIAMLLPVPVLAPLLLLPPVLELGLEVPELLGLELLPELGAFEAELLPLGAVEAELPGGQSVLRLRLPAPVVALGLVLGELVPPVVLLVCAMAAPPKVNAITEAAARRRRLIRSSWLRKWRPARAGPPRDADLQTAGYGPRSGRSHKAR